MTNKNKINRVFSEDKIYAKPHEQVNNFTFNQQVVEVFPDMINRSVPSYQNITECIGKIANLICQPNPLIYDLGCSLGNISLSIAKHTQLKSPKIIAVDNSEAMLGRCQQHINAYNTGHCIELVKGDLTTLSFSKCDLAVINFTLQFIQPDARQTVINNIYSALKPKGALIISEKIKVDDSVLDQYLVDLHHDFKKENGYSELEISQKRTALEDVMKLDTVTIHKERLLKAGFSKVTVWYQHFNFLSLLAIR